MKDIKKIDRVLRKKMHSLVTKHYNAVHKNKKFIPGETYIPYSGRVYDQEEIQMLVDSSLDFWLTSGRFTAKFEQEMSRFLNVKHCILTNSGSSANLLAVSALTSPKLGEKRLRPGDEVITTANAFPTTVNPLVQNNLVPVFVDVNLGTYNIDVKKIEKALSKKTKAILLTNTLGNPVDFDKVMGLVRKNKLWFIEDNCDALGSKYRRRCTGSFGHIATLSFYPPHQITMGEGGAVLTSDTLLKKIILSFRDWGRDCWCETGADDTCKNRFKWKLGGLPFGYDHKYIYSHIGYNLKVTDMQAAVGLAQIKKLPGFIERRRTNFKLLYEGLKEYEKYFLLPEATAHSEPNWFGFPIIVRHNAKFERKDIVDYLEKNKIATRMLFGGNIVRQPAYKGVKYRISGSLDNTDSVMNDLFWIGVYPGITYEMINYILKKFGEFIR